MAQIDFDIEAEARLVARSAGASLAGQRRAYIGKPRDPDDADGDVFAVSVIGLPNSYYIRLDQADNPIFAYALADVYNQTQAYPYGAIVRVKPYYLDQVDGTITWTILGADEMLVGEQFGAVGGDPADAYGNVPVHNHSDNATGGTLDINGFTGILAAAYGGTGTDLTIDIVDDKAPLVFNTGTQKIEAGNYQSGGILLGADTAALSVLNATADGDIPEGFDTGAAFTFRRKANNWAASAAPISTDDEDDGYYVGSFWFDAVAPELYYCQDATSSAAVWSVVGAAYIPPTNNLGTTVIPTASDDDTLGYAIGSMWWDTVTLTLWTPIDVSTGMAVWKLIASRGIAPFEITTVTTNTTLDATYGTVLVDATGGNITVTLPTLTGNYGRMFNIKRVDASANTVTIDTAGAVNIDFALTYALTVQGQAIGAQANNTQYWVL